MCTYSREYAAYHHAGDSMCHPPKPLELIEHPRPPRLKMVPQRSSKNLGAVTPSSTVQRVVVGNVLVCAGVVSWSHMLVPDTLSVHLML